MKKWDHSVTSNVLGSVLVGIHGSNRISLMPVLIVLFCISVTPSAQRSKPYDLVNRFVHPFILTNLRQFLSQLGESLFMDLCNRVELKQLDCLLFFHVITKFKCIVQVAPTSVNMASETHLRGRVLSSTYPHPPPPQVSPGFASHLKGLCHSYFCHLGIKFCLNQN